MFDVTSKNTFNKVTEWIESVYDNIDKSVNMVLIGNKVDLPREVSSTDAKKLAERYNIKYFETSAKENIGINESMIELISQVVNSKKQKEENDKIDITKPVESSSKCFC